ncbi:MAG: hypothetical protein PHQ75_02115 [Thermoguttaceae bacterium]|nr:hypothetical protein [Thermoguttaceae bacterium]
MKFTTVVCTVLIVVGLQMRVSGEDVAVRCSSSEIKSVKKDGTDLEKRSFYGYRSFEPEYETMKIMRNLGIDTVTIMVSNNTNFMGEPYTKYQPTWIWEREYDFSLFDKNVQETIAAVSDVKLNVVVDMNPPGWWVKRRRERFDPFIEFGRVAANEDYREDVSDYLRALLRHAVKAFPGRFANFFIMGGYTTEWFDLSHGVESGSRIKAWNKWCAAHGLPKCDIPSWSTRYSGVPESHGLLRTVSTHAIALNYWKFNSTLSAETVGTFLKEARKVLPKEIGIGITYGYIFELWPNCQASWSQLEYEKIFDMPEVDFALSPISYGAKERGMGGAPMAMIPLQTLKVRGKLVVNSTDTTTFTSRFPNAPGKNGKVSIMGRIVEWKTPDEVRAGLRREMCYNLINGCSTWNFDMWGGWYDSPAARQTIGECKRIWDSELALEQKEAAEILLVVDPENMYYINDSHPDSTMFVNPVRKALSTSGAMYSTASFNDLKQLDLKNYKLIIFSHPFDLDKGKKETIEKLCAGKTVMWIYAPGIIHHGKWDAKQMRQIAGAEFESGTIHYAEHSIYVPSPKTLKEDDMRRAIKYAGVHSWTDQSLPVYANARLVAIHIGKAGKVKLNFPCKCKAVTELFSGKKYENVDAIVLETTGPETLLFQYGM